jgi:hypothetical protein
MPAQPIKRSRAERHALRMKKRPAHPKRGLTRAKRRLELQRAWADAHPGE